MGRPGLGRFAIAAWLSTSRPDGPTAGSGANYLCGIVSAMTAPDPDDKRLTGTCVALLLRLWQCHGGHDYGPSPLTRAS